MSTMTITLYVGALLLLLLSIQDFRSKISKRGKMVQYFTYMSLFVLFNLIMYILFCTLLSGVGCFELLVGQVAENKKNLELDKQVLPILLAFAYFGVGSVDIPLGGKAVSFYGALLKLFQGMYKPEEIDIDPIATKIKQLNTQSDQLREAVESFNDAGQAHGWVILADKWKDLTEDRQALEAHIENLRLIQDELCGEKPVDTHKINNRLGEKLAKITEEINKKLKDHINSLVEANAENALALKRLLSAIGLELPRSAVRVRSSVHLSRAIVFSIFGGAFLSPVLAYIQKIPQNPHHIWCWMIALGVFGAIFSFIARVPKNSLHLALVLGAVAGAAGQLVLVFVGIAFGVSRLQISGLPAWLPKVVYGVIFGAFLGLIVYAFRYVIRPKLSSCGLCYLLIAIAGAVVFITLGAVIFPEHSIVLFLILGAFVAIVAAFITNIFHEPLDLANGLNQSSAAMATAGRT
jgi:hypothetical protein